LPPFDVQAPLLSLAGLFGTTPDTVPSAVPYLAAEPGRVETWRERLQVFPGFRVGIVWQGNRYYQWDRHRSIPLACFAPLAAVDGVGLVSLQKGPGADQLRTAHFSVVDLGDALDPPPGGFGDTAAVLKCLDLVVCCDSVIGHLSGALGVPTWVALSAIPDWRWLLGRDDTPWYPSMRLFRQTTLGDWSDVFARMATALRGLAQGRGRRSARIEVSPGELADRLTILEIKSRRLSDPAKRDAALSQLQALRPAWEPLRATQPQELAALTAALETVNERLWKVEDELRLCERSGDFGPRFIELARSVYKNNDERAELKRCIDSLLGSELGEPKQYTRYS
jgi:hypothetical protein